MEHIAISLSLADFLALGIVSVVVSIMLQWIKNKYGATSATARLLLVVIACLVAALYWFVRNTAIWVNIVEVLTIASFVYAFFIRGTSAEKIGTD